MRIENKELLRKFREKTRCELCGRVAGVDPAHIFSRGAGRLDVSCNILALCRDFGDYGKFLSCHQDHHAGKVRQYDLLMAVAKREKTDPDSIVQVIHFLRYLPKSPSERQVEVAIGNWDFSRSGLALARRVLEEINDGSGIDS